MSSAALPLAAALGFIADAADAIDDGEEGFARCAVERLPRLVPSELTTLSICDLRRGRRQVTGSAALGADARASFDRHFNEHPLVRCHGHEGNTSTRRISDLMPWPVFRRSALYDEYYRAIGIDHAVALPLYAGEGWLVSFVLNRRARDFSRREVALLDQLRRPLARLFLHSGALERMRAARGDARLALAAQLPLTVRERDVLSWVAAGKTDRDIADILAISPRTVHKHLQRVYCKLGVETRTAAVMRALAT
jgi:DNA-binding CsgD family transcriptional regulator